MMTPDPYVTTRPLPWLADDAPTASCAGSDPDSWFVDGKGNFDSNNAVAAVVCRSCPLIDMCREWAMAEHVQDGVWGGLTRTGRERLRRQRAGRAA